MRLQRTQHQPPSLSSTSRQPSSHSHFYVPCVAFFLLLLRGGKKPKNEKENKAKNANVLDAQTNKRIYISHSLYKKYSYQCVNKCLSPSRHSPRQHREFKDIEKASAHRKQQQAANPANRKQVKVTLPQVKSQSSLVATKPYSASLTLSHAHTHTLSLLLSVSMSVCQDNTRMGMSENSYPARLL